LSYSPWREILRRVAVSESGIFYVNSLAEN